MNLKVATVDVRLSGVEPVSSFIAKVAEADAMLRSMTKEQVYALPDQAVRAMTLLQGAMRLLEQADGPRDFSAEVGSHFSGRAKASD